MGHSFDGLRLVTFESRLSTEMGGLIERLGGRVCCAPALREVPNPDSPEARVFAEDLLAGRIDAVVFLTGVGARALMGAVEKQYPRAAILDALRQVATVARGPKVVAVLREWGLVPTVIAAEPNTWREVVAAMDAYVDSLRMGGGGNVGRWEGEKVRTGEGKDVSAGEERTARGADREQGDVPEGGRDAHPPEVAEGGRDARPPDTPRVPLPYGRGSVHSDQVAQRASADPVPLPYGRGSVHGQSGATELDLPSLALRAQGLSGLSGWRVAVQEYGQSNGELLDALRGRGAQVRTVSIYGWALPEDLGPLQDAIRAIAGGEVDAALFTSAQQARNLLEVARTMELERELRAGLRRAVIGSIGPTCSDTLRELGLGVDFEPDRTRMGDLVRGMARSARLLLCRKRASVAAGVDVVTAARVDLEWPADVCGANVDPLHDSPFLRACRRERVPYTPIWIMRQAGRYLREYRELRAKVSFLEMCKRPELAGEVTLMAVDRLGVDAAIIFADILLVVEPMGVGLTFNEGEGPKIPRPVRTAADVDALKDVDPGALAYVFEAIRLARRALRPDVPLIGFCGAPFTVASYMIEGGAGRNFQTTKTLMYRDSGVWNALMERLVRVLAGYLNGQIDAGAQAVQIFDSWAGCLGEDDYRRFVLPYLDRLVHAVKPGAPIIYFGADMASLLESMRATGVDVIGLDWRLGLGHAWERLGYDVAVQGNLDPAVLFATPAEIERQARRILDEAGGRPGHIFNLGHGILPDTPVDHAMALVDAVHELSWK